MTMPRNYFSEEEIAELEANPNVEKVSRANVIFTKEFKERAIDLYNQGYGPSFIFESNGISVKTIGRFRVDTFIRRIRKQSVRPEGFSRKVNSSKGKRRKISFETKEEELEYYKELITTLKQENEFLKKVKALREK